MPTTIANTSFRAKKHAENSPPTAPSLTIYKAHRAAFSDTDFDDKAKTLTRQSLVSGVSLFGYSGHGSQDGFFWNKNANSSTQYDYFPFVMLSTCDPYAFHHLANSMAECMLYKEDGGAIGVVGAMCSVYLPYNQYYNISVISAWLSAKPGDTFGDVIKNARQYMLSYFNNINSKSRVFVNAMCYNYCGDPALPMPVATFGAKIDKVNGIAAPERVDVLPRVPVVLEGSITHADGSVNTDYNGTATLTLYQAPLKVSTRVNAYQSNIYYYNDDRTSLLRWPQKW